MKIRTEYTCPLELTHDITKGKWKPIILWQLGKDTQSLSSLKKDILGITQKMLIEQLKELQEYGMVGKKQYEGYPLKVDYFLTKRGEKMLSAIEIMQNLGVEIMEDIETKQMIWQEGDTMYYSKGVTDADYCVLKFTVTKGRYYSNFKSENFDII